MLAGCLLSNKFCLSARRYSGSWRHFYCYNYILGSVLGFTEEVFIAIRASWERSSSFISVERKLLIALKPELQKELKSKGLCTVGWCFPPLSLSCATGEPRRSHKQCSKQGIKCYKGQTPAQSDMKHFYTFFSTDLHNTQHKTCMIFDHTVRFEELGTEDESKQLEFITTVAGLVKSSKPMEWHGPSVLAPPFGESCLSCMKHYLWCFF